MSRRTGFQQRVFVLATVADILFITDDEVTAGTEITESLPEPVNFGGTSNAIDVSNISDRQDLQILGTFTPGSIDFDTWRDSVTGDEQGYQALTDETEFVLVKFEGGSIAGGPGTPPAIGDIYDAAPIIVGTKADAETGRNEGRRAAVPLFVNGTIARDEVLVASS